MEWEFTLECRMEEVGRAEGRDLLSAFAGTVTTLTRLGFPL
jgi:hypothetical protein